MWKINEKKIKVSKRERQPNTWHIASVTCLFDWVGNRFYLSQKEKKQQQIPSNTTQCTVIRARECSLTVKTVNKHQHQQ